MSAFLESLTSSFLWGGVLVTLKVFIVAGIGGLICGTVVALLRESRFRPAAAAMWAFVWVMRGSPLLLVLLFFYDVLPQVGIRLSSLVTAMLGLTIFEAANMGEIIRGGLRAVEWEQVLAGQALGLSPMKIFSIIVIPLALRGILPPMGTAFIALIKDTSLASVIALDDLLSRAESIASRNFRFLEVLSAASVIYLGLAAILSVMQHAGEGMVDFHRRRRGAAPRRSLVALFGRNVLSGLLPQRLVQATEPRGARDAALMTTQPDSEGLVSRDDPADQGTSEINIATLIRGGTKRVATTASPAAVSCRAVVKRYGERTVLDGVSFNLSLGEVVVLMGPSGSGKSTLLRLINHLEALDAGEILVDGRHVGYRRVNGELVEERNVSAARARANIGMVFQSFNLVRHLSAIDNVCLGAIHARRQPRASAKADGLGLLQAVGLGAHADHLPHQLSGGQQQRVAIARALATRPHLLLLDEPTSALDPELVGEVQLVLRQLAHTGMTMLLATHDVVFAREVADRVIFMAHGRIVEEGAARELLDSPKHPMTRRFLRLITEHDGAPLTDA